ncbi:DUF3540 domain-containing protein [Azorhizobium doebereinerae]|uniref:DUF3540 domain-containing protein n=1 Tax=Azorhizobium doebereinerae TaxID=281091 RepID=UPI00040364FD|nr:DUF3540 domain-containing protein [Azorhizobium doebereinerae]
MSADGAAAPQPRPQPAAAPPQAEAADLRVGRVVALAGDGAVRVAAGEADRPARRAAGCLVEPAVGDLVLLATAGADSFVLSVLDRLLPGEAALSVPGADSVRLAAPQLALVGTREVAIDGGSVAVRARAFTLVGRLASFVADHLRITARRREVVADTSAEQAGSRTVVVRDTDVLEAGTRVETVAGISSASAATAVMVAKEDLRFDGKRVTVG